MSVWWWQNQPESRRTHAMQDCLPPDVQFDLRLVELADQAAELEALEHFEALRREADERAW